MTQGPSAETAIGQPNAVAMAFFFVFISITLGITFWAAQRTHTTEHFYAAGRTISAGQNGFALAGDYMSAASFLGIAGLVSTTGFDGLIYSTGWLVGWPVVLFLIAEPLRNLGRYTFADVLAMRLRQTPVRIAAAHRHARHGDALPHCPDGGGRGADPADVRLQLRARHHPGRYRHDRLRALRRDDRHHLGTDRQGGAADERRAAAGGAGAAPLRHEPGRAVRRGGGQVRRAACWPRESWWRTRSTRSRWGWR